MAERDEKFKKAAKEAVRLLNQPLQKPEFTAGAGGGLGRIQKLRARIRARELSRRAEEVSKRRNR